MTIAFRAPEGMAKMLTDAEMATSIDKSEIMRRLTNAHLRNFVVRLIAEQRQRLTAAERAFTEQASRPRVLRDVEGTEHVQPRGSGTTAAKNSLNKPRKLPGKG